MSARSDLLEKLYDEIALGYPTPWFAPDRRGAETDLTERQSAALADLVGLLADALIENTDGRGHLRSVA